MTHVFKEVVKRDNVVLASIHQLVRSLKTRGTRSILVTLQSFGAVISPSDPDEYLNLTADESYTILGSQDAGTTALRVR